MSLVTQPSVVRKDLLTKSMNFWGYETIFLIVNGCNNTRFAAVAREVFRSIFPELAKALAAFVGGKMTYAVSFKLFSWHHIFSVPDCATEVTVVDDNQSKTTCIRQSLVKLQQTTHSERKTTQNKNNTRKTGSHLLLVSLKVNWKANIKSGPSEAR